MMDKATYQALEDALDKAALVALWMEKVNEMANKAYEAAPSAYDADLGDVVDKLSDAKSTLSDWIEAVMEDMADAAAAHPEIAK